MSWWKRKQRELERERDSVKDRMFSLSDISYFVQQSTQEETNPVLSSWNHWLRHQSQIVHQSLETTLAFLKSNFFLSLY